MTPDLREPNEDRLRPRYNLARWGTYDLSVDGMRHQLPKFLVNFFG